MPSTIRPTAAAIGVNCSTALRGMFVLPGRFSFIYSPLIAACLFWKGPCCFNVDRFPGSSPPRCRADPFLQPHTKPIQRQYTAVPIPEYYQLTYFFHMLCEVHIPISASLQGSIYRAVRS